MTSPRGSYGSGYYSSSSFPDTPIYDSLVAERGTPQIAPIRVAPPYDTGSHLPALPSALPALPAAPSSSQYNPSQGYQTGGGQPQPGGLQQAPSPYIPPQATGPRGYPGTQQQPPQQQRPAAPNGYEAMRPAMPRPAAPRPAAPAPSPYEDPYGRQQYQGRPQQPGGGY